MPWQVIPGTWCGPTVVATALEPAGSGRSGAHVLHNAMWISGHLHDATSRQAMAWPGKHTIVVQCKTGEATT